MPKSATVSTSPKWQPPSKKGFVAFVSWRPNPRTTTITLSMPRDHPFGLTSKPSAPSPRQPLTTWTGNHQVLANSVHLLLRIPWGRLSTTPTVKMHLETTTVPRIVISKPSPCQSPTTWTGDQRALMNSVHLPRRIRRRLLSTMLTNMDIPRQQARHIGMSNPVATQPILLTPLITSTSTPPLLWLVLKGSVAGSQAFPERHEPILSSL